MRILVAVLLSGSYDHQLPLPVKILYITIAEEDTLRSWTSSEMREIFGFRKAFNQA